MARVVLFAVVAVAVALLAFAIATGGRSRRPSVVATINGVPVEVGPVEMGKALQSARGGRAAAFLRRTIVMAEAMRAEEGTYTSDVRKLIHERPANVDVYIIRAGAEGVRMTAIDHEVRRQCDIFTGDSARWAFGYAYDPRRPGCGPIR